MKLANKERVFAIIKEIESLEVSIEEIAKAKEVSFYDNVGYRIRSMKNDDDFGYVFIEFKDKLLRELHARIDELKLELDKL